MSVSSNRSPSPLSARPNSNPRSSENHHTQQPSRRSFSGNSPFARPSVLTNPRSFVPNTPANSPADFGRRQSAGKGGGEVVGDSSWGSEEEKENEKDSILKLAKLRSPAKGSRNFMSPTISAASKFTPSPRKKVLAERNDPVRTSMTLSDGKATFFSANPSDVTQDFVPKSEVHMDQKQTVPVPPPADEAKPAKKVTFKKVSFDSHDSSMVEKVSVSALDDSSVESLSDAVKIGSDCDVDLEIWKKSKSLHAEPITDVEPCPKEKPSCPSALSPIIAPLDADPSQPYDPKTNYLSPRPQFLHYKPNPRIELLLNKESELGSGKKTRRLEDSFMCEMSENLSDSEGTEGSQSGDSQKESSDEASSVEMVSEIEKPQVSESSLPVSTPMTTDDEVDMGALETSRPRKSWSLAKWKSVSMLLVFLVACLSISVTDSPALTNPSSSLLKAVNFRLYEPSEVASFAKANLDGFRGKLKEWSANSMAYLVNQLMPTDEASSNKFMFVNLSSVPDDPLQFFEVERGSKAFIENVTPDEVVEEEDEPEPKEADDETEDLEEEAYLVEVDDEIDLEEEASTEPDIEEPEDHIAEVPAEPEASLAELEEPKDHLVSPHQARDIQFQVEPEASLAELEEPEDHLVSPHQVRDIQFQAETCEIEKKLVNLENLISDNMLESSAGAESNTASDDVPNYKNMLGLSLIPVALLAVAMFFYKRQQRDTSVVAVRDSLIQQTKMNSVPEKAQAQLQKPSFSHNRATEVDVVGESCPSEVSSYERGSYYSRGESTTRGSKGQTHEMRPTKKGGSNSNSASSKRESFASSSTEYSIASASYGSFTTYEKIPLKLASGEEEEMMTPVRRSSRLRNQVTSP